MAIESDAVEPILLTTAKMWTKGMFRLCGLDVRRVPKYAPYDWLKKMDIRTIFDVGANTGQFVLQFHKLLPNAQIYSFEPLREPYEVLARNMRHIPQCQVFNIALGNENGTCEIHHNDYSPSSSLLPMKDLHKQAFPYTCKAVLKKIEMRRLDDFVDDLSVTENILVKIDVQGFEDQVIRGGEQLISRASALIIETTFQPLYEHQPLFADIYEMLKAKGFVYCGSEHTIRNPNDGSILQCDSVFCRTL